MCTVFYMSAETSHLKLRKGKEKKGEEENKRERYLSLNNFLKNTFTRSRNPLTQIKSYSTHANSANSMKYSYCEPTNNLIMHEYHIKTRFFKPSSASDKTPISDLLTRWVAPCIHHWLLSLRLPSWRRKQTPEGGHKTHREISLKKTHYCIYSKI